MPMASLMKQYNSVFAGIGIWLLALTLPVTAEDLLGSDDLLAGDELEVELQQQSVGASWYDDLRITLQQSFAQAKQIDLSRSEVRVEYETAPWDGAFIRLDNKYRYFLHHDQQAGIAQESFGHNKLQEAWLQISHAQCVVKVGRQGLFWGVVEGTFAVDVVTPFDYSEPLLTDYSNVRRSQDLLVTDCYIDNTQLQVFVNREARLSTLQARNNSDIDALEKRLHEEWGARITHSWEGLDLALMTAHLYSNTPLPVIDLSQLSGVRLDVERYDLYAASAAWALGRLLLELDLGYKKALLEAFSGAKKDKLEAALGFEYTTSTNHNLNAGIWTFDSTPVLPNEDIETVYSWTIGWSKTYLNDDLTMSFLGQWATEPEQLSATLLAQYQWDDYWNFASALSYLDATTNSQANLLQSADLSLLVQAKYQF